MGVAESFRAAADIDIVITSLATAREPHGSLRQFFRAGPRGLRVRALEKAGWRADLQYAPYSESGPIDVDAGMRAVTLFELRDLRKLASRPDKRVIVIAAPCHQCRELKTEAIRPLLEKPELAVWTHLVTDQRTAGQLVKAAA
jgi:DNA-binding transcriptional regulator LsrR (DeoR family)